MWKTGHSFIKQKLKETGAPLAGEMSGHVFFKERWYGFDDGLYAGARLLEILSRERDPSAVLEAMLERVHQSAEWKEYAARNLLENTYLDGAAFTRYLAERQPEMAQFMRDAGLAGKP